MNNEIEKFLKEESARLFCGIRWMYWNDLEWVVLPHKYKAQHNTILYRGDSLADALKALKGEE